MKLPVTEVQRLRLDPGDKLVVHTNVSHLKLSEYDVDLVQRRVRELLQLPDDVPVLVLPAGMDVEVVTGP
jgi:hypothetical protein